MSGGHTGAHAQILSTFLFARKFFKQNVAQKTKELCNLLIAKISGVVKNTAPGGELPEFESWLGVSLVVRPEEVTSSL